MKLLVVEDSRRLAELLAETIHAAGWRLEVAASAAEARDQIATQDHDLVVLDLGLPDGDGLTLLRTMRRAGDLRPVLIITAAGGIEDRIAGLDAGADDYLAKPFNHREFLARCRAIARRGGPQAAPWLEAGELRFDPAQAQVFCGDAAVALPPRERQLAEMLMRDVDRVVLKRRLESALSDGDGFLSPNALELAVSRLRRRLEALPGGGGVIIETVRGLGYMMRTRSGTA
ncbi:response regulator transcription factor [Pseudoxanthobacter sp.]|uniref:response regulator transcription factor n=1 Tax=Pseudoxanthobacter sp. TaxID=1925742 RepID=UPI002FE08377